MAFLQHTGLSYLKYTFIYNIHETQTSRVGWGCFLWIFDTVAWIIECGWLVCPFSIKPGTSEAGQLNSFDQNRIQHVSQVFVKYELKKTMKNPFIKLS